LHDPQKENVFIHRLCNWNDMHHKANQTTVKSLTHWQLFNCSRISQKCIQSLPYSDLLPNQMNPVYNLQSCCFKAHFNIIPHICLGIPNGFPSLGALTEFYINAVSVQISTRSEVNEASRYGDT
jgi:hypothetical protein